MGNGPSKRQNYSTTQHHITKDLHLQVLSCLLLLKRSVSAGCESAVNSPLHCRR